MPKKGKLNLDKVLIKTVALFLKHPPHTLSYSKISRLIGVPRSTLYYYFGNEVSNLLVEASRFTLSKLFNLDSFTDDLTKYTTWREFQYERLKLAVERVQIFPWAARLYLMFRDDPGPIGKEARKLEKKYLKAMEKAWTHYYGNEAKKSPHNEFAAAAIKMGLLWGVSVQSSHYKDTHPYANDPELLKKIIDVSYNLISK